MTDKELHKLSRRELLQLLLTQAKDTEELRRLSEEREEQLESLKNSYDHLKRRLDKKDEQIQELRTVLHEERSDRRIKLEEAGSIAEAALRLNGIFEVAQKAADQYLYNIKLIHEKEEPYEEELSGEFDLETEESPEAEGVNEPESIFSGEPENPEEDIAEPEFREDDPKNQEEEMSEPEPEFQEDEPEKWEVEIVDLEPEHSGKDMPASKAEKLQPRGGKKSASHKKHAEHKKRLGVLWRNR